MPPKLSVVQVQNKLTAKEKQAKAAELRRRGWTWDRIAKEVGYAYPMGAYKAVERYFKDYPDPQVEQRRFEANDVLDQLSVKAWEVLERYHPFMQNGKIVGRYTGKFVLDENGEVLLDHRDKPVLEVEEMVDDGPVLAAIGTILRIEERRAKLNGTDQPTLLSIKNEESAVDAEIIGLVNQMATRAKAAATALADGQNSGSSDLDAGNSAEVPAGSST